MFCLRRPTSRDGPRPLEPHLGIFIPGVVQAGTASHTYNSGKPKRRKVDILGQVLTGFRPLPAPSLALHSYVEPPAGTAFLPAHILNVSEYQSSDQQHETERIREPGPVGTRPFAFREKVEIFFLEEV
eukprot:1605853-Rhodomonas_salina.4